MKIDTTLVPAELEQRFSDFFTGYTQAMAFTSSRDEGEDGDHDGEPLFACRGEFTDTFPEPWADFSQLLTDAEIAELYNDAADFFMTAKDMIVTPPDKTINVANPDCEFTLSEVDLAEVLRAASILSSPHIGVQSNGDKVNIVTFDANDNAQHTNSIEVSDTNVGNFRAVFLTENLKMIPGSYDVEISSRGLASFKNTIQEVDYWIALEAKESNFGV